MSTTSIKINDDYVDTARGFSNLYERSLTGQINYFVKLGILAQENPELSLNYMLSIAEDNPDLPLNFILDILKAKGEVERGETVPFIAEGESGDGRETNL
ncbi:TA system antitoxin ParD family protein [Piscirickettsia litoralis]|uniref:Transcriptional regulator n=1 Tax=Piscirickettsia litoralis TaxID=1891921 RepID=A0ABX2ZXR2_9GAMM|nr:hypothetical protein [Piscirickettsia litoralis]ODN41397.1 hypothetical protein BGC07_16650 [Piscirickettsia litoralis]